MLIAVAVPAILVVDGFRVLATDTFVEWELGRSGFPPDLYGFDTEQRTALAKLGLRSIEPASEGIVLLGQATLPNGSPAFGERELTHMQDVRRLFGAALRLQLVALIAIVALGLALWRTRLRAAVPAGLLAGSLATLAIAALAVPVILLGFDGFFVRFHEVLAAVDAQLEAGPGHVACLLAPDSTAVSFSLPLWGRVGVGALGPRLGRRDLSKVRSAPPLPSPGGGGKRERPGPRQG